MYNSNGFTQIMNYGVATLTSLVLLAVGAIFAYACKEWNNIDLLNSDTKQTLINKYNNVINDINEPIYYNNNYNYYRL